jgi:hypothetical protein
VLPRLAAASGAGAASGFVIQCLAMIAVSIWNGGEPLFEGGRYWYGTVAGIGALVGAAAGALGERIFLRAMPTADVLDAWPRLFLVTLAAAIPALAFWALVAWATNPAVFFAACAWERHRFERRLEADPRVR